jgi:hypothetical protein
MNPFEQLIREVADVIEAAIKKNGSVVTELIELVVSVGPAFQKFNELSIEDRVEAMKQALDSCIGDEADAVIGPEGKVKFSIPFVGTEMVTDLIINAAAKALKARYEGAPTSG